MLLFSINLLATEPPPTTSTQPIPTYAPDQLPYKATSDYVWSKFNNNATTIFALECNIQDEKGNWFQYKNCGGLNGKSISVDGLTNPKVKAVSWGGPQCSERSNECIGNGPLGMGSSVILRNTSTATSKVSSPKFCGIRLVLYFKLGKYPINYAL